MTIRFAFITSLLCALGALGCSKSRPMAGTDGATHFLVECDASTDCGPLACVCGVCSKDCKGDGQCTGLDDGASCLAASAASCSGGQRACAVECDDRDDCSAYGARAQCQDGRCTRPAPDVVGDGGPAGGGGRGGASGSSGGGRGGSSGTGGGASGTGSRDAGASPCLRMDARSNGTFCAGVAGYSWNGVACEAVLCGCAGSDCDEIYASQSECEAAYRECPSLTTCTKPSDCVLASRGCCSPCAATPLSGLVSVANGTSDELFDRVCEAPLPCPSPCSQEGLAQLHARYLPACLPAPTRDRGQCSVLDLTALPCTPQGGCHVRARTCCECGANLALENLIAVPNGSDLARDALCDPEQACDDCLPSYPNDVLALCGPSGFCELQLLEGTAIEP